MISLLVLLLTYVLRFILKLDLVIFERVYEELLYYELTKLGLKVQRQLFLPIQYEEVNIENAYKLDLLVEDKLILE